MTKVFIDGSAGTTGLRIADRLASRQDITLVKLPEEKRKDIAARKEAINRRSLATSIWLRISCSCACRMPQRLRR